MTDRLSPRRVIVDCDPGYDDAIALLLALSSPEIDVLGITTVSGNHTVERTTANAIRILDHFGRDDIPVVAGAPRPLLRARHEDTEVHGETGLDGSDLPSPNRPPAPEHAIDWIAEKLEGSPSPVTLVGLGPLTNIGLLLMRYPELTPKIEHIVLMGGSLGPGNVTPAAEFNIWADPEAAYRVFTSGAETTMIGLDVTQHALIPAHQIDQLAKTGDVGQLVARLHDSYLGFYRRHYGLDAAPIHDAVVIAHLLDPDLLKTKHCAVLIDTGQEPSRGRTYVDQWHDTTWEPNCHVALKIDDERFRELLISRLTTVP